MELWRQRHLVLGSLQSAETKLDAEYAGVAEPSRTARINFRIRRSC